MKNFKKQLLTSFLCLSLAAGLLFPGKLFSSLFPHSTMPLDIRHDLDESY